MAQQLPPRPPVTARKALVGPRHRTGGRTGNPNSVGTASRCPGGNTSGGSADGSGASVGDDFAAFGGVSIVRFKAPGRRGFTEPAQCSICYEAFRKWEEARALPCASYSSCHSVFHGECLRAWLNREGSCPLCRRRFSALGPARQPPAPTAVGPLVLRPTFMLSGNHSYVPGTEVLDAIEEAVRRRGSSGTETGDRADGVVEDHTGESAIGSAASVSADVPTNASFGAATMHVPAAVASAGAFPSMVPTAGADTEVAATEGFVPRPRYHPPSAASAFAALATALSQLANEADTVDDANPHQREAIGLGSGANVAAEEGDAEALRRRPCAQIASASVAAATAAVASLRGSRHGPSANHEDFQRHHALGGSRDASTLKTGQSGARSSGRYDAQPSSSSAPTLRATRSGQRSASTGVASPLPAPPVVPPWDRRHWGGPRTSRLLTQLRDGATPEVPPRQPEASRVRIGRCRPRSAAMAATQ
eukprot:TRINITY_DN75230_c0_g1_i1.p1 TRINITY_DN75230_c0_g1~~TRINITY_DN75230_c0_g1_i1.p1  ORF type:complete len:478 (-),score=77.90 TRINITY_DN75230_c0_g1_i1:54-1487(-)